MTINICNFELFDDSEVEEWQGKHIHEEIECAASVARAKYTGARPVHHAISEVTYNMPRLLFVLWFPGTFDT